MDLNVNNDTNIFEENITNVICDTQKKVEINENETIKEEISHYDTLVLSGGSSKGIIILGALQYLIDNYLISNIETYIGTSVGSIICYLLLIGYTPIEIIVYICKNQLLEKREPLENMQEPWKEPWFFYWSSSIFKLINALEKPWIIFLVDKCYMVF
jgi:hypothetical protein